MTVFDDSISYTIVNNSLMFLSVMDHIAEGCTIGL